MSTDGALATTPWDPEARADPHGFWHSVRDREPVLRAIGPVTGRPFWYLTRYEDCVEALHHPSIGHSPELHLPPEELYFPTDTEGPFDVLGRNMLFSDPPDHTRLRRLVRDGFSKRTIDRLRPRVEEVAKSLLDATTPGEPFDIVAAFAEPLPVTIIAELLGVPSADRDRFRRWTAAILGNDIEAAQLGGLEFVGYLNDLAEDRRATPRNDMVTELVHAEVDGERLDHTEYLAMVFLLLVAGHETTVNLIGNGVLELHRHPDARRRWASDPGLDASGVEELVRHCGPVETATMRWAYEDVEIGGRRIRRGEPVIPVLYAANRDPAKFDQPDTLAPDRSPNPHIGFGFGIHHCLGAPLARLEARVAFRFLFDRHPQLEVVTAEDDIPWPDTVFLRGPKELVVVG